MFELLIGALQCGQFLFGLEVAITVVFEVLSETGLHLSASFAGVLQRLVCVEVQHGIIEFVLVFTLQLPNRTLVLQLISLELATE